MNVLGIGEVLWDVFPNQEHLGGAALNFCANVQRLGGRATLISGVGNDDRGHRTIEAMQALGLHTRCIQTVSGVATGIAIVQSDENGEPVFHISRPAAFDRVKADTLSVCTSSLIVDWIYFGTLLQTEEGAEAHIANLMRDFPNARRFYDVNLRKEHWSFDLVRRLSQICDVLKLNLEEAKTLAALSGTSRENFVLMQFCDQWSSAYSIDMICVTLGSEGCLIYNNGRMDQFDGFPVSVCDTVGAGDAFAAAFLHGYHLGWPVDKMARFANAAGAVVASRAGATPEWTLSDCEQIAAQSVHRKFLSTR
jgi:fructokinase